MREGDGTAEFFESFYAGAGEDYAQIPWAQLSARPVLVDWLDAEPPSVGTPALVVACGLGDDAEELARRGCDVDAFDVSPTAIAAARHRFPGSRVRYLVADLFALPPAWRGRFGVVVEVQTLQSLPPSEHRAAVAAISTCLAPGGRMFLRTAIRGEDEPAPSRPWPLTLSELRWFEDEGLELTARLAPGGDDGYAHLEYRRPRREHGFRAVRENVSVAAEILRTHPLVEQIFDAHRDHARGDDAGYDGYRGHAYRVLNLARAIVSNEPDRDDKLAVAAAFHDLDAFTSLDYLASSIRAQDAWLESTGRAEWGPELAVVIAEHHRLTPYRGPHPLLAEAFRRADLADLSHGLVCSGIPRAHVRAVRGAFSVGPFFTRVVPRAIVRNLAHHPLDPVPILRARRALTEAGHAVTHPR